MRKTRNDTAPPQREGADEPHYEVLERTGFFGEQAAGAVIRARDTGRFLLLLRSERVLERGTWGNCGGAHHAGEEPEDAARREIGEETGWVGEVECVLPAFVFRSGGFTYRNFVAVVPEEFEPSLGWEATDHRWCTVEDLPSPLHFGVEALLSDPASLDLLAGDAPDACGGKRPR